MTEANEPATPAPDEPLADPDEPLADPDDPRTAAARARGLAAPYVVGGRDPDIEATRRQERVYLRLLVIMVVVIVLAGFVLGIISSIVSGGGR